MGSGKLSKIECYEDLVVWQKAHKFVLNIYEITKKFPINEQFGLTYSCVGLRFRFRPIFRRVVSDNIRRN